MQHIRLATVVGCVAHGDRDDDDESDFVRRLSFTGFFVTGLGIGMTLPSVNLLILEMNPQKRSVGP
jgi:hypothetical protein